MPLEMEVGRNEVLTAELKENRELRESLDALRKKNGELEGENKHLRLQVAALRGCPL
jgi:hypothetical protein